MIQRIQSTWADVWRIVRAQEMAFVSPFSLSVWDVARE